MGAQTTVTSADGRSTRVEAYEQRSATTMVVLAFVFLGLYATQVLWLAEPPWVRLIVGAGQYAIWAVFIADFVYRVYLAEHRWQYLFGHPLDLLTLLLPMLRPLRGLRIFAAARVLIERGHHVSYGRVALAIMGTAAFVVLVGALVVLDFERLAADSSITTFWQALWWAVVTITTVGYGDLSPVTVGGQIAATVMMMVGISLLGAVTASFATWFTHRVQGHQETVNEALMAELLAIRADLQALRQELASQKPVPEDGGGNPPRF